MRGRRQGEVITLDRKTYKSVMRARERKSEGRWPGIGDPAGMRSIAAMRVKEIEAAAAEAKPKRVRKAKVAA